MDERFLKDFMKKISPPKQYIVLGWVSLAFLIVSMIAAYGFLQIYIIKKCMVCIPFMIGSGVLILVSGVLLLIFGTKVNKYHTNSFIDKIDALQAMIKKLYYSDCEQTIKRIHNETIVYNINSEIKKVTELLNIYESKFQEIRRKKKLVFEAISVIASGAVLAIVKVILEQLTNNIEVSKIVEYAILILVFVVAYFLILFGIDSNLYFFKELNLQVLIAILSQYRVMLLGDTDIESNIVKPKVIRKVEINDDESGKEFSRKINLVEINIHQNK